MATHTRITASVVVPVYNEVANLEPLVERLRTSLDDVCVSWEAVLVNDGSSDGSALVLDRLAAADSRLRVVHLTRNFGQSAALDAGFSLVQGEYVATLDADLQSFPEDLPDMLETLKNTGVDAVVGIRSERHDTAWRRLCSRIANRLCNCVTGEDVMDTGCPTRVFRSDVIRNLRMFDGMHRFLPALLRLEGYTITQVPVRHARRRAGRSKYGTWDRAFRICRDALAVRWMKDRRLDWRIRQER